MREHTAIIRSTIFMLAFGGHIGAAYFNATLNFRTPRSVGVGSCYIYAAVWKLLYVYTYACVIHRRRFILKYIFHSRDDSVLYRTLCTVSPNDLSR